MKPIWFIHDEEGLKQAELRRRLRLVEGPLMKDGVSPSPLKVS